MYVCVCVYLCVCVCVCGTQVTSETWQRDLEMHDLRMVLSRSINADTLSLQLTLASPSALLRGKDLTWSAALLVM